MILRIYAKCPASFTAVRTCRIQTPYYVKLKDNTFILFKTSSIFASSLKPSHSSMYDFQKVYILPTEIIYVFCTVVGRKSNYSLEQYYLLVFTTEKGVVYCAVRT